MSGNVQPGHDDQGLNGGENGPGRLRGLRLAHDAEVGRSDDVVDDGLGQDVPHCRHGHRMSRRSARTSFARGRILQDVREDHGAVVIVHFVDPPVRTVTVHQPVQKLI